MQITIESTNYQGTVSLIASKSYLHRAIFAALIAKGTSKIFPFYPSEDVLATLSVVQCFQASYQIHDDVLWITSNGKLKEEPTEIQVNESATTLRLAMGLMMAKQEETVFLGTENVFNRPLDAYQNILQQEHITLIIDNTSLTMQGRTTQTNFTLDGSSSSGFVSGLLFYLAYQNKGGKITVQNEVSSGYIDMTIHMLQRIGIKVEKKFHTYTVHIAKKRKAATFLIEGDASSLPMYLMMGTLGEHPIQIHNVPKKSLQKDLEILKIFKTSGAKLKQHKTTLTIYPSKLTPFYVDLKDMPDLGVALILLAGVIRGTSIIKKCTRLVGKETNRLMRAMELVRMFGAKADYDIDSDQLLVSGTETLPQIQEFHSCFDHRIVFAILGLSTKLPVPFVITDVEAVKKSYPTFFDDLLKLKGGFTLS